MKITRGISPLNEGASAVSIGNFDGVHLGHQHVINTLLEKSALLSVPACVITFDPLAKEFFQPNSVARLTTVEQRADLLFSLGVDHVVIIEFCAEFAAYSPLGFVEDVLINGLGAQFVCVGDDFKFGKNREGDFRFLKETGNELGFEVAAHPTFELEGSRVSSGRVRQALSDNQFALARQLLGRPYAIEGQVMRGQQLGRTLNFPTANLVLGDYQNALNGVFAVTVRLKENRVVKGVANIGRRPSVDGLENRLEVHLFDFSEDIYGTMISVQFLQKLRDERKFESLEALQTQIGLDVDNALAFFDQNTENSGF